MPIYIFHNRIVLNFRLWYIVRNAFGRCYAAVCSGAVRLFVSCENLLLGTMPVRLIRALPVRHEHSFGRCASERNSPSEADGKHAAKYSHSLRSLNYLYRLASLGGVCNG